MPYDAVNVGKAKLTRHERSAASLGKRALLPCVTSGMTDEVLNCTSVFVFGSCGLFVVATLVVCLYI